MYWSWYKARDGRVMEGRRNKTRKECGMMKEIANKEKKGEAARKRNPYGQRR